MRPNMDDRGVTKTERLRIAEIQMSVTADKEENLAHAAGLVGQAMEEKPDFIALPEMFCCPYTSSTFSYYAEEEHGPTDRFLAKLAKKHGIWLIGGSMPERDGDAIYNTCYIYDRMGRKAAKHRKVHLFDVTFPDGKSYRESRTLSPGKGITVFDTEYGKCGVIICFDIRFPRLFEEMQKEGVRLVFVPASFNMTSGPAHWELLFRSRAVDNQIYMAGISTARDEDGKYVSYGHSIAVDPWGKVLKELDEKEGILTADLDLLYLDTVRSSIPIGNETFGMKRP